MNFSFHPEAREELYFSIDYYEDCQEGLGLEFSEEVYATIQRIIDYPEAYPKISQNTRRCLTNRFPYGIIYQIKTKHIYIIAVTQLNRRPGYWKDRK